MNSSESTTRNAVIYLASTNSRGRSGYATATCVKADGRDPYSKWFAKGFKETTRRDATVAGLHEALKNIQSKCDVIIYCNERFVDDDAIKAVIAQLDNVKLHHKRATGRLTVKVCKPTEDSPQSEYLKKVSDLAKWARATGCKLIYLHHGLGVSR